MAIGRPAGLLDASLLGIGRFAIGPLSLRRNAVLYPLGGTPSFIP